MPIEISEVMHTSAPVVPQVDRILITNIPLITAFPLMKNYLTAEELSYATYDTSSLYGSILQRICCNISRFQRKNIY